VALIILAIYIAGWVAFFPFDFFSLVFDVLSARTLASSSVALDFFTKSL